MAKRQDISADLARQLLDYDPLTGILRWKARIPSMFSHTKTPERCCRWWNTKFAGKPVESTDCHFGYIRVILFGKAYPATHIIWLMEKDEWPESNIDHESGKPWDNKFSNLRPATKAENGQNYPKRIDNTSGYPGVTLDTGSGKWRARIAKDGKRLNIGNFSTPEEAYEAYKLAKRTYHTFNPEVPQRQATPDGGPKRRRKIR